MSGNNVSEHLAPNLTIGTSVVLSDHVLTRQFGTPELLRDYSS